MESPLFITKPTVVAGEHYLEDKGYGQARVEVLGIDDETVFLDFSDKHEYTPESVRELAEFLLTLTNIWEGDFK